MKKNKRQAGAGNQHRRPSKGVSIGKTAIWAAVALLIFPVYFFIRPKKARS